ncbi:hypothetical protein BgiMline_033480 [Biomphalaria glabrata]
MVLTVKSGNGGGVVPVGAGRDSQSESIHWPRYTQRLTPFVSGIFEFRFRQHRPVIGVTSLHGEYSATKACACSPRHPIIFIIWWLAFKTDVKKRNKRTA